MKKKLLIVITIILFIAVSYRYRTFIPALYYEYFISYDASSLPKKGGEFVVKTENAGAPNFIKHVIKFAFPEYKIVYSNNRTPNLVIRTVYRDSDVPALEQFSQRVPYISYSPEKSSMKYRRYRVTGFPFFEFISNQPDEDNHIYIPYASYHHADMSFLTSENRKVIPKEDIIKRYNVVHVFRHCVPMREKFFKLLNERMPDVHAPGKCSHNTAKLIGPSIQELIDTYSKYKFVIAIENAKQDGYVTEKIINAYKAGAVPIYWGDSKMVGKYFNKDSYIDLDDFENLEQAADHVQSLGHDPAKMQKILSAPILTKEGETMLKINNNKLGEEAEIFLRNISKKFRKYYMQKIHQKSLWDKLFARKKSI